MAGREDASAQRPKRVGEAEQTEQRVDNWISQRCGRRRESDYAAGAELFGVIAGRRCAGGQERLDTRIERVALSLMLCCVALSPVAVACSAQSQFSVVCVLNADRLLLQRFHVSLSRGVTPACLPACVASSSIRLPCQQQPDDTLLTASLRLRAITRCATQPINATAPAHSHSLVPLSDDSLCNTWPLTPHVSASHHCMSGGRRPKRGCRLDGC